MKARIAIAGAIISVSFQVAAVDGYKELKFGMSLPEVLSHQPCTLEKRISPFPQVDMYVCEDLPFGGSAVNGFAFFLKGKFLRFAIEIPDAAAKSTVDALARRYGKPSKIPSQAELKRSGTVPGARVVIGFDSNTVLMFIDTQPTLKEMSILVYTAPNYNALLAASQAKDIDSDL